MVAGASIGTMALTRDNSTGSLCRTKSIFSNEGSAGRNQTDLIFSIHNGPVLRASANDIDLLEERRLVPVEADLLDLLVLIEVHNVDLMLGYVSGGFVQRPRGNKRTIGKVTTLSARKLSSSPGR
jgi:hypothetical protein